MGATRRTVITAAGAGLAAMEMACAGARSGLAAAAGAGADTAAEDDVAELFKRAVEANAALMLGDVDTYRQLTPTSPDFLLMSPFGGKPTRGTEMTEARWDAMRRFFRNGALTVELVQAYRAGGMVVLAVIERPAHLEVGGLPAQDWALRVTLVFRRDGAGWRLVHRHADPLVAGISVQRAAAIARGEFS